MLLFDGVDFIKDVPEDDAGAGRRCHCSGIRPSIIKVQRVYQLTKVDKVRIFDVGITCFVESQRIKKLVDQFNLVISYALIVIFGVKDNTDDCSVIPIGF